MTHLQMQQQLDHLYRYQTQHQAVVPRQQQQHAPQQAGSRAPPHRPDSSLQQRNSHSSIAPPSAPLPPPSAQQMAEHQYSLELHRQQQAQLQQRLAERERQRQASEERERQRRNSEEEYLRRLAVVQAYGGAGPLSGSPHPQGNANAYFTQQGQQQGQADGPHALARPPSHPHPSLRPAHSAHPHTHAHMVPALPAGMHPHPLQAHLGPLDGAYPPHHLLLDGAGRDPLELGVLELEATPAGMIKYESPLE